MLWFLDPEYENLGKEFSKEGASATIYKVRHRRLGYVRAIKVLKEPIEDESDPKFIKFLHECQLLLRLGNGGHPNIVRIIQPRLVKQHALVEMEFIHGLNLYEYLLQEQFFIPIDEVLRFISDISSALSYCHVDIYKFCADSAEYSAEYLSDSSLAAKISEDKRKELIDKYKVVHNDIHSKNVMRKEDGSYILLDFGLSFQGSEILIGSQRNSAGAVEYKAPEKWKNDAILSEQSDMYSFGILMYEMLTGNVPFRLRDSDSFEAEKELWEAHLNSTPPAIEGKRKAAFMKKYPGKAWEKDYPDWLEIIIMKCLEKEPSRRYTNAYQMKIEMKKTIEAENQLKADNTIFLLRNELAIYRKQSELLKRRLSELKWKNKELEHQNKTLLDAAGKMRNFHSFEGKGRRRLQTFSLVTGLAVCLLFSFCYLAALSFNKNESAAVRLLPLPSAVKTDIYHSPLEPEMVFVRGGTFTMGCSSRHDKDCYPDEQPEHKVTLNDFYIAKYELTQAQWKAITGKTIVEQRDAINKSWELFGMGDDYPVYYISWDDAQIFIEQLNRKTGKRFRMPTEAEWEYAARGGAHSANYKYSGSNDLKEVAWFDEKTNTYTHPVGAKKPNELGIYDMSGNVWEWCSDWFGKYSATNQSNPQGATVGREKVCRGGGWYTFERPFRVFYRTSNEPQTRNSALGIRLASDAPSNR